MRVTQGTHFRIKTTPNQLRAIADRLDEKWKNARVGEDVPAETIDNYGEPIITFMLDQEAKRDEERAAY